MKRIIVVTVVLCFIFILPITSSAENPKVFKLGFMSALSGTLAAPAETQKRGVLLAVDELNAKGGLKMPWGPVKVEVLIKDDEAKLDVGVRRFRELVAEGINALTGSIWNPMMAAINEQCKVTPVLYIPAAIAAYDSFKKGNIADMYVPGNTPWTLAYVGGACITNILKKKTVFHLSRSDSWGITVRDGLDYALKKYGGKVVGMSESSMGTIDYTPAINKAISLNPDVFYNDFFGGDAIASFKQAHELGLDKTSIMFNAWMTNVVAVGIPPSSLDGLYALEWWYYDMPNFEDKEVVRRGKAFTEAHMKKYNEPPDAYTAEGYVTCEILFHAVEKAGSFDTKKISKAILETKDLMTLKGPVYVREDHQMVFKYAAFLLKGKGPSERKSKYDLFKVEGSFGGESVLPPLSWMGY
jgi:branched-chain amino acid transport system substrate-binding protein